VLDAQSGAAFRRGIVTSVVKHYAARLAGIRAKRVCEILTEIGCGDDAIYALNDTPWTPRKLLEERMLSPSLAKSQIGEWLATSYRPVQFIGGPPNNWGIWRGSLLTFMLDRIAVLTLLEGWQAMDKIISPGEKYLYPFDKPA
jgi:hypothetical protein